MNRQQRNIRVHELRSTISTDFYNYFLGISLSFTVSFQLSDLPKDAPVFNIDEIINLDTQKLQTETTGAKIVSKIQDWLLTRVSSQETAILPEDKMQRLLVGVSNLLLLILLDSFSNHSLLNHCFTHSLQAFNQLEIATHIEMVASMLRRDATRIIKTVLAGTGTEKLTNVLEATFGEEEPPKLRKAYKEALEEEEEEEEEGPIEELAPSTSKGGKQKQSAPPYYQRSQGQQARSLFTRKCLHLLPNHC